MACVASPDDDDSSYEQTNTALAVLEYSVTNSSLIGGSDTISNVAITIRIRKTSGTLITGVQTVVGANVSAAQTYTSTTSYVTTTFNFPLNPTGGAWTLSDINALQIRIKNTTASLTFARLTTVQDVVVTYTASTFVNNAAMLTALVC